MSFSDVVPRVDPTTCCRCRRIFKTHDRLLEVLLAAGVTDFLWVSETREYAHVECADEALTALSIIIPRKRVPKNVELPELRARVPDHQCVRCRARIAREDRLIQVLIVEGIAIDPQLGVPGVRCSNEYEVCHVDCTDRDLAKGPGKIVL